MDLHESNGSGWMIRELLHDAGALTVIVPAFNEERRLPRAIHDIAGFLRSQDAEFEIIVVDDGSRDGTADTVAAFQAQDDHLRLMRLPQNQGKGAAVKAGMVGARGDVLLFTDADQSTSIDQLPRLLFPLLRSGFDIAIGSRAAKGARIVTGQVWYRQKLGKTFGVLAKLLLVRGYADSQCGFKCFRREAALAIFPYLTSNTALFDMEVLLLAARRGFRVAEVPVVWRHDPDSRLVYDLRKALAIVRELLRLRREWKVVLPARADVSAWSLNGSGPVDEHRVCQEHHLTR
ncbi:MAG: hypothetical protein A3H39_10535 [candidate division NC10 bacterium RIFCSPLOWO2_02_FULL_66_22]|nr:MAG: hypothetical protein A3H39_10535 [candidate division NC10 bacterium RIFCSPLOWO2_02_FULL_66_22]